MKLTRVLLLSVLFITLFAVTAGAMPDVVWPATAETHRVLS
jgi:hypothetical protein